MKYGRSVPMTERINCKQRAGQLRVPRAALDVLRELISDAIRKDEAP
jgi:hypothetical protein